MSTLHYNVQPRPSALRHLRGLFDVDGRSAELPPVYEWTGEDKGEDNHPQRPLSPAHARSAWEETAPEVWREGMRMYNEIINVPSSIAWEFHNVLNPNISSLTHTMSTLHYNVQPCPSALRDLRGPLDVDGRSPELPPIYEWTGEDSGEDTHPQRPLSPAHAWSGRTYVIFIDPSDEGKALAQKLGGRQKIPLGRQEEVEDFGGDWVFVRVQDSDGDPMDDIVQVMYSARELLSPERDRLLQARDRILGERPDRTADQVRFERSRRARCVRKNDRAYGIGEMVQQTRRVEAPAAAAKVYNGELDEDQRDQKEFLSSASPVVVNAWEETAPEMWREGMRKYNEVINGPITGCPLDGSLVGQMHIFGDSHTDKHDAVTGLSSMTVLSDLPDLPGQELGCFHFLAGRLPHRGTAPLAAPGSEAAPWAYRCVLIGYPPRTIMEGNIRHTLAALPHRAEPLYISPEMTGVNSQEPDNLVTTNHSNYASDGVMTMSPLAHLNFYVRSLLQLNVMLCRQLPRGLNVHIHKDRFLDAFRACLDGESLTPSPWELGPDGAVHETPNGLSPREIARREYLETFYRHVARAIPTAPNDHPEPVGSSGRPKNAASSSKPAKDGTTQHREAAKAAAAKAAGMSAVLSAANFPALWDAPADTSNSSRHYLRKKRKIIPRVEELPSKGRKRRCIARVGGSSTPTEHGRLQNDNEPSTPPEELGRYPPHGTRSNGRYRGGMSQMSDPACSRAQSACGDDEKSVSAIERSQEGQEVRPLEVEAPDVQLEQGEDSASQSSGSEYHPSCTEDTDMDNASEKELAGAEDHDEAPDEDGYISLSAYLQNDPSDSEDDDDSSLEEELSNLGQALSKRRAIAARAFIGKFNQRSLSREIVQVQNIIRKLETISPQALGHACEVIGRIDLGATPSSQIQTSEDVGRILGAVTTLRDNSDAQQVWSNLFRQRVMLCEQHFSTLLVDRLQSQCEEILTAESLPPVEEQDRFTRLVVRVRDSMASSTPIHANSTIYVPDTLSTPAEFHEEGSNRCYNARQLLAVVPPKVLEIIRTWFGIPSTFIMQARAHFIQMLLANLGAGALLMPHVWEVYIHLPSWMQDTKEHNHFTDHIHGSLSTILTSSTVSDRRSPTFHLLHGLREQYRRLVGDMQKRLSALSVPYTAISSSSAQGRSKFLNASFDAEAASGVGPQPLLPDSVRQIRSVKAFLMAALQVANDSKAVRKEGTLEAAIQRSLDKFQPLRHLGTSRTRINGRAGEHLDTGLARSRVGLFTLLVFHNVLFNSPYLLAEDIPNKDRRVIFTSPEDFRHHTQSLATKRRLRDYENFFCNRSPYSTQVIKYRSTSNIACRIPTFGTNGSGKNYQYRSHAPSAS
ncbi:hypothetical protein NM688_g3547 [Phlebia brevispora]|uniref:Uncharacterized protein n=1 Tax=Phlebia brevispora TaxID=194682 RepID=A0ACC1T5G9_9APHY|nr:hypothetical protein NM688_g3547 [Phlebia brevispora]